MANTGRKIYNTLVEIYTDTGLPTGTTKSNNPSDPDYIPPVSDLNNCPPPEPIPQEINQIRVIVLNSTTQSINLGYLWVRPESAPGIGSAYLYKAPNQSFLPNQSVESEVVQTDILTRIKFGVLSLSKNIRTKMIVYYKKSSEAGFIPIDELNFLAGDSIEEINLSTPTEAGSGINTLKIVFTENPIVLPPENQPPVVDAGPNTTITLPTNSATITGTASDSDGTVVSTIWSQVSGPNTATIETPSNLSTIVSGLIAGEYIFNLTATDNLGLNSSDTVKVVVAPEPLNPNGLIIAYVDNTMPDTTFKITQIRLSTYEAVPTNIDLLAAGLDKTNGVTGFTPVKGTYKLQITLEGATSNNRSLTIQWNGGGYEINLPGPGTYTFENVIVDEGINGVLVNYLSIPTPNPSFVIVYAKLIIDTPITQTQAILPNGLQEREVGDIKVKFFSDAAGTVAINTGLDYYFTENINNIVPATGVITQFSFVTAAAQDTVIISTVQRVRIYDYDQTPPLIQDSIITYTPANGQGYLIIT